MNTLELITKQTLLDIAKVKTEIRISELKKTKFFNRKTYSLSAEIKKSKAQKQIAVIAEFKRKSPSKGVIKLNANLTNITQTYQSFGASALSILTNSAFDGNNMDIEIIRNEIHIPILRKEFIIDEYQIYQAKAIGADAILLIATCLTKKQVNYFAKLANGLNLEVLLEIHNENELDYYNDFIDVLGVNNRNLKTFEVSIEQSINLLPKINKLKKTKKIKSDLVIISESGIAKKENLTRLTKAGFDGFLIGESLMKSKSIAQYLSELVAIEK